MKTHNIKFLLQLIFLIIFLLIEFGLYSQTLFAGVKGGISIPQLNGSGTPQSEGNSSRLAPNFGGFVNYRLTSNLSLQEKNFCNSKGT